MAAVELRSRLSAALSAIASRTAPRERCIILSGGVDTCAILACARELGVTFGAGVTVLTGPDSPDREFAITAAKEHFLPHHIVEVTSADLIDTYLPACVKALATFDGMTLRNSLVVAAAMRKASELGFRHAVVGDGADELFAGYSFMWGNDDMDPAEWKAKRDKMCAQWTFATGDLAAMYGLESHSPYTEPDFVAWAVRETQRFDCVGVRPIRLTHGGERVLHQCGKLPLREAFDTISSWRRKDPIEVGSGITVVSGDAFWSDSISDEELAAATADMLSRGYALQGKEHLANFRAFEACFGRDGADHPKKKRLPLGQGCAGCCFEIGEATFCDVCGAYPAQRAVAAAVPSASAEAPI
ncbi:unnamed protein product [Prorocentrum cordatum]|uniref:Asparagine synthetase domain-containing protein n=1 Tax=Prorocentrum cordatum TaxID=2364126 RepID=A0ABN9W6Y0_9DINO|nr:unnamed protein product [Polarella glacialis]